jgi:ABC-type sugar transport system ATPase subunit
MIIEIKNLKKKVNNDFTLEVDSLKFEEGLVYSLTGPNGSGKSTLLKIISGVLKPDSGKIYIKDITPMEGSKISYLPQKPYIFNISVYNNIALGINENSNSTEYNQNEIFSIAQKLGLENLLHKNSKKLSGSESQKVAIARTFIQKSKIYLLDEPFSFLDNDKKLIVENFIQDFAKKSKSTVIFTTHEFSTLDNIENHRIKIKSGALEKGK